MFYPSKKEFMELSKQGNLIPVYKELAADMETPVSAYRKIDSNYSFLLESVEGGERIARYSFLGADPNLIFASHGEEITISVKGKKETKKGNPFHILKVLLNSYKPVKIAGLPRFHGGLVGYVGYDTVRFFENIPDKNIDDLKVPDLEFVLTDTILVFDHVKHKILVISNSHVEGDPAVAYDLACKKIEALIRKLRKPLPADRTEFDLHAALTGKFKSNISADKYKEAVKKAKEHIAAGDVIQVVPSQRIETELKVKPFNVYRALRMINPSPYMFYLHFGKTMLIGASPETMVRLEEGVATIRPIAGTRPRGANEAEDLSLAKELLADPKERAEHVMLVDLARNDLGRVCQFNTVKMTREMEIERYSHVMHIVSEVEGKIQKDKDAFDLLEASFPAGTVTGAPKVRAMEIIDGLETTRRGPYAGAVGYFSFSGDLDTCITIRTILVKDKKAYVQAGAGIVADSNPETEYQETLNKARALLSAVSVAGG
ncbi:MAG: anthranilate synthase component I [Candidatus Saganbacteria bacterium]|nr:anthranilate synthase component I [Candidatus Saganbacteria bacterium]